MFRVFIFIVALFSSVPAFAEAELKSHGKFDLGIHVAPTFTPETDYENSALRFGTEIGYSFFIYEDNAMVDPQPTIKLLRVGLGLVVDKPVLVFTPISTLFRNNVYLNPSIGFGEKPYTMMSITYEIQ